MKAYLLLGSVTLQDAIRETLTDQHRIVTGFQSRKRQSMKHLERKTDEQPREAYCEILSNDKESPSSVRPKLLASTCMNYLPEPEVTSDEAIQTLKIFCSQYYFHSPLNSPQKLDTRKIERVSRYKNLLSRSNVMSNDYAMTNVQTLGFTKHAATTGKDYSKESPNFPCCFNLHLGSPPPRTIL